LTPPIVPPRVVETEVANRVGVLVSHHAKRREQLQQFVGVEYDRAAIGLVFVASRWNPSMTSMPPGRKARTTFVTYSRRRHS